MSPHSNLKAHLGPVVRRQSQLALRRKLAACWIGAALLGLGVFALQRLTGWTSNAALLLTALLGIIATTVVIRRHGRSEPNYREIARQIEARYPELDGRLITAVQQENKDGSLNYLQERLVRESSVHSLRNDWAEV